FSQEAGWPRLSVRRAVLPTILMRSHGDRGGVGVERCCQRFQRVGMHEIVVVNEVDEVARAHRDAAVTSDGGTCIGLPAINEFEWECAGTLPFSYCLPSCWQGAVIDDDDL